MAAAWLEPIERGTRRALNEHAYGAIGQLEQLQNLRDHAHVEQVIAFGIVAARIELREQEDVLAAFHRRLERRHRFVTSDKKRDHHAGEDDDVA